MAVHTIQGGGATRNPRKRLLRKPNASRIAKAGAKGGIGKTVSKIAKKKRGKGYTTSHLKKP